MRFIYFFLFLIILFTSCHKEEEITTDANAKLEFSADTIFFDTLFSSTKSITKRLKVFNKNNKAVKISSIELGGKASSPYQVIINGQATWYQNDLTLRGGDSIYVLISTIVPSSGNDLPFIVNDSLLFYTNGNQQQVQLMAIGQDATFINGKTLPCDTTWTNVKPFVLYNKTRVAPGCTLTIEKGVKLFFHNKASLCIEGTLVVKGEKGSEVVFSGDNLDVPFKELPGQWEGIVFESTSKNNDITYGIVRNAVRGITIQNDPTDADINADLTLNNCIVKNMQITGVVAYNRDVSATNCLFTNSVRSSFAGYGGGNYDLNFCTIANYSYDFFREDSTISFSNNIILTDGSSIQNPLIANLTNCIVWGDYNGEISLDDNGLNTFLFQPNHCILKTRLTGFDNNGNKINTDPLFVSPVKKDFHLQDNSPAIDAGIATTTTTDIEDKTRSNPPDIGAYEK